MEASSVYGFSISSGSVYLASGLGFSQWCRALLLLTVALAVRACQFPDYVQNGTHGIRDWKGKIKNQFQERTLK